MTKKERIRRMGYIFLALSGLGYLLPELFPAYFVPEHSEALYMMSGLFSVLSLFCFFSRPERLKP